jgi:hypothetical protein
MTKYSKTLENSESAIKKLNDDIKKNEGDIKQAEEDIIELDKAKDAVTEKGVVLLAQDKECEDIRVDSNKKLEVRKAEFNEMKR